MRKIDLYIFVVGVIIGAGIGWFIWKEKGSEVIHTVFERDTVQIVYRDTVVVHDTLVKKDSLFVIRKVRDTVVLTARDTVIKLIDTVSCRLGRMDIYTAEYYIEGDEIHKRMLIGGLSYPLFSGVKISRDGTAVLQDYFTILPIVGSFIGNYGVGLFGGLSVLKGNTMINGNVEVVYNSDKGLKIGALRLVYQRFIKP